MPKTLKEIILEILEVALESGLKESEFWEMDLGEVARYIKAFNKRELRKAQVRANETYILSTLIGEQVTSMFDSNYTPREFMQVYSYLFEDVEKKALEEKKAQKEVKVKVAKFREFAEAMNKRRAK